MKDIIDYEKTDSPSTRALMAMVRDMPEIKSKLASDLLNKEFAFLKKGDTTNVPDVNIE